MRLEKGTPLQSIRPLAWPFPALGFGVRVGVGPLGVRVGVRVGLGVRVGVRVGLGVRVGVDVGVNVGVIVGV